MVSIVIGFNRFLFPAALILIGWMIPVLAHGSGPLPPHASEPARDRGGEMRPMSPERQSSSTIHGAAGSPVPTVLARAAAPSTPTAGQARIKSPAERSERDSKSASVQKSTRDGKRPAPRRPGRRRAAPSRQDPVEILQQYPTPPTGSSLSVLVVGDSLAVGVGMTMDSAFQGRGRVVMKKMGKVSTGLDSPRFYDWNSVLRDVLDREAFDVVVIMLGANDAHNSPGTSAWGRQYEAKFTELLRIPAEKRVKTLVVGLPPMRKEDFCQRVRIANEAIRNAARFFPETCAYIDSFSPFSDPEGKFTDRVLWKGEWKTVRAGDGVHFTGTGYLMLSRMVADEALRRARASVEKPVATSMAALP